MEEQDEKKVGKDAVPEGTPSSDKTDLDKVEIREELFEDEPSKGKASAGAQRAKSSQSTKIKPVSPSDEERKEAKAEYKQAKRSFKEARKRAGKSALPKVIALIVAFAVLAAAGAVGGWYFTTQSRQSEISGLQSQLKSTQDQLNQAQQQNATSKDAAGSATAVQQTPTEYQQYLGTWGGALKSTSGVGTKRCYGASSRPMTLDIKMVASSGQVQLDASVPYHGHATSGLDNDVAWMDGDTTLSVRDVTSTFDGTSFSFKVLSDKESHYAMVTVSPSNMESGTVLNVMVQSWFEGNGVVETDQYVLTRQEGQAGSSAQNPQSSGSASASAQGRAAGGSPETAGTAGGDSTKK